MVGRKAAGRQDSVGKWQKYRRLYDSRVCQHLTWLTFWIAQHFVVPLFLGILQPGKDAPSPSVSDFLIVSNQHTLTLYAEADVITSCPESSNISIPSLPFVVSLPNNLDSPLPVVNVITHPFVWTHPNMTIQGFWIQLYLSFDLVSSQHSSVASSTGNPIKYWYPHH